MNPRTAKVDVLSAKLLAGLNMGNICNLQISSKVSAFPLRGRSKKKASLLQDVHVFLLWNFFLRLFQCSFGADWTVLSGAQQRNAKNPIVFFH
jgi:hypothetical protein